MAAAAHKSRRRSSFERISEFVLNRVRRRRTVTVGQLRRTLTASFGASYFRRRQNVTALQNAMEYLLYTKRMIVICPNAARPARSLLQSKTEAVNANANGQNDNVHVFSVITQEALTRSNSLFYSNPLNILAQNACTKFDPFKIALSRQRIQDHIVDGDQFFKKVKRSGNPITNQKNSGRCWIFACLNVIRVSFMKKYNIKQFEFSQAYLFFWDKIERSNFFLNAIVTTAKKGHVLASRTVMCLLKNPVEDGGYWSMAVNLIKKYGLIPKLNYPESYSSQNSKELNEILNSKLRQFAVVLHDLVFARATDQQISDEIEKDMCVVYRIVGICLGVPCHTFKWYYRNGTEEPCLYQILTPLEFYERVVRPTFDLGDKVSLISDPRANLQFGKLYTLDLVGNVVEGSKIMYNNQPMDVLLEACKQSVTVLGEPVWYSCEVNQSFSSELGIEDLEIRDIQSVFGVDISLSMTKGERILYRDSSPTHAMVLTGAHINDNDNVSHWRVENSWGKMVHVDGIISMTTEWFREYVFEVVVDKKLLPKCVLDVFDQEPTVLPVWDHLGAFAFVN